MLGTQRWERSSSRAWTMVVLAWLMVAMLLVVPANDAGANLVGGSGPIKIDLNPTGSSAPGGAPGNQNAVVVDDKLYVNGFGAGDYTWDLFEVDGTNGTLISDGMNFEGWSSLVEYDGELLFSARQASGAPNFWVYDGAAFTSVGVNPWASGSTGVTTEFAGDLYMGDYFGLETYDGSAVSTVGSYQVREIVTTGDGSELVFGESSAPALMSYDGTSFQSLWSGYADYIRATQDHVFFVESGDVLAYTPSTGQVTEVLAGPVTVTPPAATPDGIYLGVNSTTGREAFYCVISGCTQLSGTPGDGSTQPYYFTATEDTVYFLGKDTSGVQRLWAVSAGTTTASVVSIGTGGDPRISNLKSYGGTLYVSGDGGNGTQLWAVDGVNANEVVVGVGDTDPVALGVTTGGLYFSAEVAGDRELWYLPHPVDTTAPTIDTAYLADNPLIVGSTTTLSGVVSDADSGVADITITDVNGTQTVTPAGDGSFTVTVGPWTEDGLHNVDVAVTDQIGNTTTLTLIAVIYDPATASSRGHGFIVPGGTTSEVDDFLPGIDNVSPARFAYWVKYKPGNNLVPDGELRFDYWQQRGPDQFRILSHGFEWVVVTNQNWAHFQGLAAVTGFVDPAYVRVSAWDSPNGNPDRFIIKVWAPGDDPDTDEPVYRASGDVMQNPNGTFTSNGITNGS